MENFPKGRLSEVKPFCEYGFDYCGPIAMSQGQFRGANIYKTCLCLFVALEINQWSHVRYVFRLNFLSHRGRCNNIYSDQGANIVCATKQISLLFKSAVETELIKRYFNRSYAPPQFWRAVEVCIQGCENCWYMLNLFSTLGLSVTIIDYGL